MNIFVKMNLRDRLQKSKDFADYLYSTCDDPEIRSNCITLKSNIDESINVIDELIDQEIFSQSFFKSFIVKLHNSIAKGEVSD